MRSINFLGDYFELGGDYGAEHIKIFLRALVESDIHYLRTHPRTPNLYDAGVRYEREPPGQEHWKTIPEILSDGFGDCEDLASWRVAELRVRQNRNDVQVFRKRRTMNGIHLFHIVVRYQNGQIEDPSKILGM